MKFLFEKSNYHEAPPIIITNPKKDKYKFRNCVCVCVVENMIYINFC